MAKENRILSLLDVQAMIPFSRSSLWRLEKQGDFPKRVKLTPNGRRVGWKESEIQQWIESREATQ
jgi:prophage regulatory protein